MRIYNPQNQLGEKLMTAAAVKALMESHLSLAERTGDAKVCGEAASTAVAMFPEDEDFKYSECTNVDELMNAGFSGPTTEEDFNRHLTMLENMCTDGTDEQTDIFNHWEHWNSDLPCLTSNWHNSTFDIACSPFANGPLISFNGQLPNLTTQFALFEKAIHLDTWKNDLPNLVNGSNMFSGCTALETFEGALPSLLTGA